MALHLTDRDYVINVVGPFLDRASAEAFTAEVGDGGWVGARWRAQLVVWPDEVRREAAENAQRAGGAS